MYRPFAELTPVSFLRRSATVFARRPAVVDADFTCDYAELWQRTQRMAGVLAAHGVRPGDRVALLAPNTHLALEAHYGVPLAGAVLVALNIRLSPADIAYTLDHCAARVLLVDSAFRPLAEQALAGLPEPPVVIDSEEYERLLGAARPLQVEVADERGLLSINYTSGTTGRPKGVMFHHRGAYLTALGMALHASMDSSTRYLWTLPMFHCNGWCFPWTVTAVGGVHLCLRKAEPAAVWEALGSSGATHLCAAPTVLALLSEHPAARTLPHRVRAFVGGAPPWPGLLARLGPLGFDVQHLYGLTETFGPALLSQRQPDWDGLPAAEWAVRMARQGVANVVGEPVALVGPDGHEVPADGGTLGEIVLRGNNIALGYYRDPAATALSFRDDGLHTGDLAVRFPDGYVQIRDRAKDIIISGGENIASVEVEQALCGHPAVGQAAVVAAPHEIWGEVPVAFVACRPGRTVAEQELIDYLRARLAHFKVPRRVVFGELPTTSTGKPQKNLLREQALSLGAGSRRSGAGHP